MKTKSPTIATLGSHSALDVCAGAKAHGFPTLVVCQKGREKTYDHYYKTSGNVGCVDQTIVLSKFKEILSPEVQSQLKEVNSIFIPNRSFEVYLNDYEAIEKDFQVPMFGNKFLLRMEEREGALTQYDLLEKAGIRFPQQFKDPKKIDRLCIVKAQEKERTFERAFFFVSTPEEFEREYQRRLAEGKINPDSPVVIEEYMVGVQVNYIFFYSPLEKRLELLGTDTRRQTNISGLVNMPASEQMMLPKDFHVQFEEAGHIAVTTLESMLEQAFEIGEKFVRATQEVSAPGVIGPFSLQAMIVAGPPKKDIVVFDVSPRMPGSPGVAATPYTNYLFGKPMSVGERVALEVKNAVSANALSQVTT
jgi:5-formaminoimidazole-4-carboxamide-1-(beta)-D-ribofuranosyl 5'-monophosphate synthetase